MPINPNEFPRPGKVYIKEINASVRETPIQEQITTLVPGFSKKGIYNKPVLISNPSELFEVFGPIDRNLERKGSFFHRTILNLVNKGPVWALNLLNTDPLLDTTTYQTLSSSTIIENSDKTSAPYENFFLRKEFWERDVDSVTDVANENISDPSKLIHFVNLGSKTFTVFSYKSPISGFDLTAEDWFNGPEESVPAYMHKKEYISDWFIRVAVVEGDFSNYSALSVDPKWEKYFSVNGLIKSTIDEFLFSRNTKLLGLYDASLIPYFKDKIGRSYDLETLINQDTNKTGLFVSYDNELLESLDFNKGYVDLVGNGLVRNPELKTAKFLSYSETIQDILHYPQKRLQTIGNVFATEVGNTYRGLASSHAEFSELYINDFGMSITSPSGPAKIAMSTGAEGSFIFNGEKVVMNFETTSTTHTFTYGTPLAGEIQITPPASGYTRIDTFWIDADGNFGYTSGTAHVSALDGTATKPNITADVMVLGYLEVDDSGAIYDWSGGSFIYWVEVGVDATGTWIPLVDAPYSASASTVNEATTGITTTTTAPNLFTISFNGPLSNSSANEYRLKRILKAYNFVKNAMTGNTQAVVGVKSGTQANYKKPVTANSFIDATVSVSPSIVFSVTNVGGVGEAAITGITPTATSATNNKIMLFFKDDEFVKPTSTGTLAGITYSESPPAVVGSRVGLYSDLLLDFVNGVWTSGDYVNDILQDINSLQSVTFDSTLDTITFLTDPNLSVGDTIIFKTPSEPLTDGFTTTITANLTGGVYSANVPTEIDSIFLATEGDYIFIETPTVGKKYINSRWKPSTNTFSLTFFLDEDFVSGSNYLYDTEFGIFVKSSRSSYIQTVDIDSIIAINKIQVDASRYAELEIGNFLEAAWVEADLEVGEVPRKLTRIIEKVVDPNDSTKILITTDSEIHTRLSTSFYQTRSYVHFDEYATNLKALVYEPFSVRADSVPDGSNSRQNEILDVMAKGTSIYNSLKNFRKINWRYLVDSFGLGLEGDSKEIYFQLASDYQFGFALVNMPSFRDFKLSNDPSFVDSKNQVVIANIKKGANPGTNPSFKYSFTTNSDVSSYGAYFFPNLKVNDNGRPLLIPPSSIVADAFLGKFSSRTAGITPFTVVAGISQGKLSGISNVESDFSEEELITLSQMGANPIVYYPNNGFAIEFEYTAQINPTSALSSIHVRELLIELERELHGMLIKYNWKFNTPEIRAEIKFKADRICQRYKDSGGLYDFLNVMDTSNNTPEIIDAETGVLDTFVEPIRAMGKLVNNITILRTGDISLGRFRIA